MPNDLDHAIASTFRNNTIEFTTLEVRIIEHLVASAIDERIERRKKMLAKPSSRRREADAEFEMSLEPLHHMRDKIAGWLNARRGPAPDPRHDLDSIGLDHGLNHVP